MGELDGTSSGVYVEESEPFNKIRKFKADGNLYLKSDQLLFTRRSNNTTIKYLHEKINKCWIFDKYIRFGYADESKDTKVLNSSKNEAKIMMYKVIRDEDIVKFKSLVEQLETKLECKIIFLKGVDKGVTPKSFYGNTGSSGVEISKMNSVKSGKESTEFGKIALSKEEKLPLDDLMEDSESQDLSDYLRKQEYGSKRRNSQRLESKPRKKQAVNEKEVNEKRSEAESHPAVERITRQSAVQHVYDLDLVENDVKEKSTLTEPEDRALVSKKAPKSDQMRDEKQLIRSSQRLNEPPKTTIDTVDVIQSHFDGRPIFEVGLAAMFLLNAYPVAESFAVTTRTLGNLLKMKFKGLAKDWMSKKFVVFDRNRRKLPHSIDSCGESIAKYLSHHGTPVDFVNEILSVFEANTLGQSEHSIPFSFQFLKSTEFKCAHCNKTQSSGKNESNHSLSFADRIRVDLTEFQEHDQPIKLETLIHHTFNHSARTFSINRPCSACCSTQFSQTSKICILPRTLFIEINRRNRQNGTLSQTPLEIPHYIDISSIAENEYPLAKAFLSRETFANIPDLSKIPEVLATLSEKHDQFVNFETHPLIAPTQYRLCSILRSNSKESQNESDFQLDCRDLFDSAWRTFTKRSLEPTEISSYFAYNSSQTQTQSVFLTYIHPSFFF